MLVSKYLFLKCSKKKTREYVVWTFKNICTIAVHCWYKKVRLQDFFNKLFKQIFQKAFLGLTKTFVTLSRFWLIRGWQVWVNLLKKENLWQKSFFQIMWNEVLKSCRKMISADIKTNVKQEIKELVAVSYKFSLKYLQKTWNTI